MPFTGSPRKEHIRKQPPMAMAVALEKAQAGEVRCGAMVLRKGLVARSIDIVWRLCPPQLAPLRQQNVVPAARWGGGAGVYNVLRSFVTCEQC